MKKEIFIFSFTCLPFLSCFSQNNALKIDNGYIVLNGGTSPVAIYLVINQPNPLGIVSNNGSII